MMQLGTPTRVGDIRGVTGMIDKWFPLPKTLFPAAAGIDISDTSLKWIVLEKGVNGGSIKTHGQETLPAGIIENGVVQNIPALAEALSAVAPKLAGIDCVHAALPEESAYVFSMHVPKVSREQVLAMIEFELEGRVPISPKAAVYDFDVIESHEGGEDISVYVFPRELAESYATAFAGSGLRLLSLELEARSAARAVSSGREDEPVTLLVDFGRLRTGLAVLKRGMPIFTSTVLVGGEMIDRTIKEKIGAADADVMKFKNEEGLLAKSEKLANGVGALNAIASSLAEEIARHHHFWDTRRNEKGQRVTPVERVYLLGGSANLKGLGDFIAAKVQADVIRPNVWQHVCSFDEYIPSISRRESLEYATAIGLALRGM